MAALSSDRNTPARSGNTREAPVKAGAIIFAGAMVALDDSGWAVPATAAPTLRLLGRSERRVDNLIGGNGGQNVRVVAGVFRFDNSAGGDLIVRADIGQPCFAVDDHTVAKTAGPGSRSRAGTIFDVEPLGVWVAFE